MTHKARRTKNIFLSRKLFPEGLTWVKCLRLERVTVRVRLSMCPCFLMIYIIHKVHVIQMKRMALHMNPNLSACTAHVQTISREGFRRRGIRPFYKKGFILQLKLHLYILPLEK